MRGLSIILLLLFMALTGCQNPDQIFKRLSEDETGIFFNNKLQEDENHNVYRFMNFYTGAGVSTGDINNDGLTDLYFSGNLETGRLFLNQGNLKFVDITSMAGLENNRWGTGTTMVDVNQDGWLDIYVCVSGSEAPEERANMLYVNNGDNTFREAALSFGIADQRQTQHAAFFDYDRDGDLDLFLIINPAAYEQKVNVVQPRKVQGEAVSTDVLYRNNGDNTFTDVSKEAGILVEGYSLGVGISDISGDGWPDIYISNDFVGNDVLYINNQDGTFSDQAAQYLQHTSYAGMGNDIADFNNDGLVDIMVLDMRPQDNLRQKLIISSTSYDRFQLMLESGYQPQYSRNTLQLNRGDGHFSEVGFMAGVSSTDWSWSALFADYDNDGDKDLFITNGFMRDLGNLDYIHYQNIYDNPMGEPEVKIKNKLDAIKDLQGADIRDYLYENKGNLQFEDRSTAWGITKSGFSNGAIYVDLDNDGDLEIVVNNINEPAHVYMNTSDIRRDKNYLQLKLFGPPMNRDGVGTKVQLFNHGKQQVYEHYLSRGYESSVDPKPHFGLGPATVVDSLIIHWPDGKYQILQQVPANQLLTLKYNDAVNKPETLQAKRSSYLREVPKEWAPNYRHQENPQVDFKTQPILPHMHSQGGPGMAAADVNGDGLEDFYVGGAGGFAGRLFLQRKDSVGFLDQSWPLDSLYEDMGALFFDAEGDGDQDLFVVSGGTSHARESVYYQDRLYLNDGNGNFSRFSKLPVLNSSGSSVVGADFDKDGDIDLFVGGRVVPGEYPMIPQSYLLVNESNGRGIPDFTELSAQVDGLANIGMVTSALWTDYDNDDWLDLMIVGEFMPIAVFKNHQGKLRRIQIEGLEHSEGWWNSLTGGDFDNDGDTDYIAGNLGLNTKYRATPKEPLCIYASDYDKNGRLDPVMCHFVDGDNYIVHTRDDMIKQISAMRARFKTYQEYAGATFQQSFLPSELKSAYVVKSKRFESSYLENTGKGSFRLQVLPIEAQMAPVFGVLVNDYNGDGMLDAIMVGNSYSTEVSTGRYDAFLGLLMLGTGDGSWLPMSIGESGIAIKGDAKGMIALNHQGKQLVVISNNNDDLKSFSANDPVPGYKVQSTDQYAMVSLRTGTSRKVEFYYGSTYLSHTSRMLYGGEHIEKIRVTDRFGKGREVICN